MNLGDQPRTDRGNIVAMTEQGAAYHPAGLRSGGRRRRRASSHRPAIDPRRTCARIRVPACFAQRA